MRLLHFFLIFCLSSTVSSLALPLKDSRRDFLGQAFILGLSSPAFALQEKNEALCGTGFFTNIWQYKCTEIGDIEDEGESKALSTNEESSIDSLMTKFNLEASPETKSYNLTAQEGATNRGHEKEIR